MRTRNGFPEIGWNVALSVASGSAEVMMRYVAAESIDRNRRGPAHDPLAPNRETTS